MIAFVLCLQATLISRSAAAQSFDAYRGQFGQRPRNSDRQPLVDFSMSFSSAHDNGGDTPAGDDFTPQVRRDGSYSMLDTAMRYTAGRRHRLTLNASNALLWEPHVQRVMTST